MANLDQNNNEEILIEFLDENKYKMQISVMQTKINEAAARRLMSLSEMQHLDQQIETENRTLKRLKAESDKCFVKICDMSVHMTKIKMRNYPCLVI